MILGQDALVGTYGLGRVMEIDPEGFWIMVKPYATGIPMKFAAKNVQDVTIIIRMSDKYRHHKHPDSVYSVIGNGHVQAREPLRDMEEVAIYRGDDGRFWVRRKTEFEDGRFARIGD